MGRADHVLVKTRAQTSARLAASLLWWEVDASALFLNTGEHTCGWSKNSLSMHTKVKRPGRFVPLSREESKKWCHYNSTESGKQWLGGWVWKPARYQYMYILASTTNWVMTMREEYQHIQQRIYMVIRTFKDSPKYRLSDNLGIHMQIYIHTDCQMYLRRKIIFTCHQYSARVLHGEDWYIFSSDI